MYLPKTPPLVLQTDYGNEQYNTLNVNDLGGGYCAANKPFNLLTNNLFRCSTRAPDVCVVSLPDSTIWHVIQTITFAPWLIKEIGEFR